MCKILHMVHNHTQIHNRGINNYYVTSHIVLRKPIMHTAFKVYIKDKMHTNTL